MIHIHKILVPTDFSSASDAALHYARDVSERFGASLHLLHVLEDPFVSGPFGAEAFGGDTPGVRTTIIEDATTRLAQRLTTRDRVAFAASAEALFGREDETIVDYAAVHGIDLIVMGTHGRTGMAHLLLGSVAEKVVRTATCAVLTVRGEERLEHIRLTTAAAAYVAS